ncbi:kelch-like protein 12 [Nematostella vectensis]|uniref:kelch-like protein 12 n=1 Tax=Nematostella vectensis TaxID=45351 RepID=UPI0020770626|nr:kelch-like protein 12 [Nematostella vectensis]
MGFFKNSVEAPKSLSKNTHPTLMEGLLLKSLNDQRQSKILCDVVLLVENEEFSAHKGILAANSHYFMAMFTTDMIEKEQERVILKKLKPSVVKEILDFLYTGRIEIDNKNVRDLLEASSFLIISSVNDKCWQFLEEYLNVETCLIVLSIADEFYNLDLYKKALKFLCREFLSVAKTREFLELSTAEIKELLSSDDIYLDDEIQLLEILIKWVNFDRSNRRKYIPELMKLVRFHFIKPGILDSQLFKDLATDLEIVSQTEQLSSLTSGGEAPRKSYSNIEVIIIAGGVDETRILDTVCCYIPSANKWCELASMNTPRWRSQMVLLNNSVLAIGGLKEVSTTNPEIPFLETYQPRKDSWQAIQTLDLPFPVESDSYQTGRLGDEVIFVGDNLQTSRVFGMRDIQGAVKFTTLAPTLIGRIGQCVVTSSEYLYVIGGSSLPVSSLTPFGEDAVQRYNRDRDVWVSAAPMNQPRFGASAASIDNKVYVIGGCHGRITHQSGEVYDPSTERWTFIAPMATARVHCATAVHDGKLWVFGGLSEPRGSAVRDVECYDPDTNNWTSVAPMPGARADFSCSVGQVAYRTVCDVLGL